MEPLAPADVVQALQAAQDWEEVLTLVALGAHYYLPHVQVYLLKRDTLVGYLDLTEGHLDQAHVQRRRLVLSELSGVSQVIKSGIIFIGTPPAGDLSIRFLRGDAGVEGRRLVMVPVIVSRRPFCLLVGEVPRSGPTVGEMRAPMARLAIETGLILTQKGLRHRRRQAPRIREATVHGSADKGESVELKTLIDLLEAGGEPGERAHETLRVLGTKALPALLARFPGTLQAEHDAALETIPPVRECSAVLEILASIGPTILPSLPPLLKRKDPGVRFFATYLLSELPEPSTVVLLARQVSDRDPLVGKMALRILRKFSETGMMEETRQQLLEQLKRSDVRKRVDVCRTLGGTGDLLVVPHLIEALGSPQPQVTAAARGALVRLTKQDFRLDTKRWAAWWAENRWRKRPELLFEGLVHRSAEVRVSSAMELEEMMGHCFSYEAHLPKKDRERIRSRCQEWWNFQKWWAESGISEDPDRPMKVMPLLLPGRTDQAE